MELEELQANWVAMSQELENQKKLTNEIIVKMTRNNYRNKFSKLTNYETVGAVICYILTGFIVLNFGKLDTLYLKLSGVLTIAFLTVLPTLVLRALKRIRNLDILQGSYKENLIRYTKEKNRLLQLQQIAIFVSFLSVLFTPALALKLLRDKTLILSQLRPEQGMAIVFVLLLMVFVSRWGYRSYKKLTNSAETLLRDLEE
ncbi:hypothetical protein [Maribacter sp. 4G9]|uniref:hypothetical protein n=1 Tax=Maribacter sp. 4G9 TaxID=1889777 RepID=UPI000C1581E1|nr:hypothetical protein [Maribacter sp. 4G9]PIB37752.1 hypothetical protein BFP75_19685 [Maribacter sp. 4G9]